MFIHHSFLKKLHEWGMIPRFFNNFTQLVTSRGLQKVQNAKKLLKNPIDYVGVADGKIMRSLSSGNELLFYATLKLTCLQKCTVVTHLQSADSWNFQYTNILW